MKKKEICLLLTIFFLLSSLNLFSLSYFVSPSGNDSSSGLSATSPFRTIQHARDKVQTIVSAGLTENIVVYIMEGYYFTNSPIVFSEQDSGNNGYTITYTNYLNKESVIAGGTRITSWLLYSGSVYYAYLGVSAVPLLYENRVRATVITNPLNKPLIDMINELTKPGRFYYDTGDGYLYYYPRNNPISLQMIYRPEASSIISITGSSDSSPGENLVFSNLICSGTNINSSAYTDFNAETGVFHIENARNVTIQSCEALNAGVSGIVINKFAQNIRVADSRVDGYNLHGISLRGYLPGKGTYASASASYVNKGNNITHNYITGGGSITASSAGIRIIQSGDNTVTKNSIRNVSGNGIFIHSLSDEIIGTVCYGILVTATGKWDFIHSRNNVVSYNDVSRVYQGTGGGGIMMYRPGKYNVINLNRVHDCYATSSGTVLTGINLGDYTEYVTVDSNIVHSIVSVTNKGRPVFVSGNYCTLKNNIVADNNLYGDIVFDASSGHSRNLSVTNNIFSTLKEENCYVFEKWDSPSMSGLSRNLFYHPDGSCQIQTPYSTFSFSNWQLLGYDSLSTTAYDPGFEERGSNNYKVSTSSPAYDLGFVNINHTAIGNDASFAHRYARDLVEAERCTGTSGAEKKITVVRGSLSGDYAQYGPVYFEQELQNFEIKYSCSAASGTSTGGEIEMRLGSTLGTKICTIPIVGTGSLGQYRISRTTSLSVTGPYDLYLIFRGSFSEAQADWFRFYADDVEVQAPSNYAPKVSILAPREGDVIALGAEVVIRSIATDSEGTVTKIWLHDGTKVLYEMAGGSIVYNWRPQVAKSFTIKAYAIDNEGLVGEASITVTVSDMPRIAPVVEIVSPVNNEKFIGPANIYIRATASDEDNGIRQVDFYQNDKLFRTIPAEPFEFSWENVAPGNYKIKAIATDKVGITAQAVSDILVTSDNYLIGHWTFDAIVGGTAEDVSGNKNNGVVFGAKTTTGMVGNAYSFDGYSSVETGKSLMNMLPQFTMTAWIKPERGGTPAGIFGQKDVVSFGFVSKTGLQIYTIGKGGLEYTYPFSFNEWHHIAVVGDGEGLMIYVDGVLRKGRTPDQVSDYGESSSSFNIGGGGIFNDSGDYYVGAMDDVKLYRCAVSEKELKYMVSKENNLVPEVKITSPVTGSQMEGPLDITIKVDAKDTDSGIQQVELYLGNEWYETDTTAPYEFHWYGVQPNTYTISAKAIDNQGAEAVDTVVFSVLLAQSDLIAYWGLNEGVGAVAGDASGNGNHGKITSPKWATGVYGTGLAFDGYSIVDTRIGLVNDLKQFTIALWINPTDAISHRAFLGQFGMLMFAFSDEKTLALWTLSGSYINASFDFPLNEWHHVAAVGTGKALFIYIDGELIAKREANTGNYGSSDMVFNFGGVSVHASPGEYFRGNLDEIYIYNKALSEQMIATLAVRPDQNTPSMKIVSPLDMSEYTSGEKITVQTQVIKAGLPEVSLRLYADGKQVTKLTSSFSYELTFTTAGQHIIMAKAYSGSEVWAEDSVTIVVRDNGDSSSGSGDNSGDSSSTSSQGKIKDNNSSGNNSDSGYEPANMISTKYMHATEKEIIDSLKKSDEKESGVISAEEKTDEPVKQKKNLVTPIPYYYYVYEQGAKNKENLLKSGNKDNNGKNNSAVLNTDKTVNNTKEGSFGIFPIILLIILLVAVAAGAYILARKKLLKHNPQGLLH